MYNIFNNCVDNFDVLARKLLASLLANITCIMKTELVNIQIKLTKHKRFKSDLNRNKEV